ncbi:MULTISPECIES: hypothetical protein [Pseudomonadaceae]|nr:hypothetical protein [Pseudomonas aeruginosa]
MRQVALRAERDELFRLVREECLGEEPARKLIREIGLQAAQSVH